MPGVASKATYVEPITDPIRVEEHFDAAGNLKTTPGAGGAAAPTNLTQVGGVAVTEGQKAMATSIPVAIASDQSTIPASPFGAFDTTNGNAGIVAAPGAGAAVASITPGAGTYEVQVITAFSLGIPAAADGTNMRLQRSATGPLNLTTFFTPPVLSVPTNHRVPRVTLAAAETLTVNAIAAATAGVSYAAEIIAQRVV